MTLVDGQRFGEVAEVYDDVRPGYPDGIGAAISRYHRGPLTTVLEIGAGTGKGTAVLKPLGGRLTCLEPDPRMAAVLRNGHPDVEVIVSALETACSEKRFDGVACAMAWHWLDPRQRNQKAFAALRPGGTLALFGHRYGYADPGQRRAIDAAFAAVIGDGAPPQRTDTWNRDDVIASGLFGDVDTVSLGRQLALEPARYLQLVQTFGPFRARDPEGQARLLEALERTVGTFGGPVVLDLPTTVTLARRPERAGRRPAGPAGGRSARGRTRRS